MGELAYRSEQPSIRIVNRGSTFWLRLRLALKGSRALFLVYLGVCVAIAVVFMGWMAIMIWNAPGSDPDQVHAWFATGALILVVTLALGIAGLVVTAAFRSISPDPAEQLLPRELHLFEDHVMVVPFTGASFHTPWSAYVLGATAGPTGLWLLLGREPRLEFFVRRGALSAREWTLIQRWLAAQDLLGG